jgi:dihydrofolate synthase/folylpolyglutamate synthase
VNYDEAIAWLQTLPDFERTGDFADRPDVEPMRALLSALGDPHRGRAAIHVAGSKGKGSVTVMCEAILRAAGMNAGAYISPHLHRYEERIRLDGAPSSPDAFAAALTAAREGIERVAPSLAGRQFLAFDAITAAGFIAFREHGCDAQVVEVGLGGLLDSTNVFGSVEAAAIAQGGAAAHICVITPISLEHTAILGSTIPEIAAQKAGIIVPGGVVIVGPQRESALDVIRARAAELGARVVEVATACQLSRGQANIDGQEFRCRTARGEYRSRLPLLGRHQLENAATAIVACEELWAALGGDAPELPKAVARGVPDVRWPARVELLRRRAPIVIVDGAHNGDSMKRLVQALREDLGITRANVALGTLAGKDARAMIDALAPIAETLIAVSWPHARAMPADEVMAAARAAGVDAVHGTIESALDAEASGGRAIVACGSLAFAAQVRAWVLGLQT